MENISISFTMTTAREKRGECELLSMTVEDIPKTVAINGMELSSDFYGANYVV